MQKLFSQTYFLVYGSHFRFIQKTSFIFSLAAQFAFVLALLGQLALLELPRLPLLPSIGLQRFIVHKSSSLIYKLKHNQRAPNVQYNVLQSTVLEQCIRYTKTSYIVYNDIQRIYDDQRKIYDIYIYIYTMQRYFSISYVTASSDPVERVFSRIRRIILFLRSRLSPRHLELLTLIACITND